MSKKVEVKSIVIQYTDGETKQLSLDDARALFNQLEQLFGQRPVSYPIVIERERWPHWWPVPTYTINTEPLPINTTPQIWCCSNS